MLLAIKMVDFFLVGLYNSVFLIYNSTNYCPNDGFKRYAMYKNFTQKAQVRYDIKVYYPACYYNFLAQLGTISVWCVWNEILYSDLPVN